LSVFDHCLRSRNYVNIVTCGKQPQLQWLNMDEALEHCSRGASAWKFATNDGGGEPDVVLACAGDVPTIEMCAASWLLQKHVPGIKVRLVNVVDLSVLMMPDDHPHGMDNMSFNALFTTDAPVIFAFHNNRWLIHTMEPFSSCHRRTEVCATAAFAGFRRCRHVQPKALRTSRLHSTTPGRYARDQELAMDI